MNLRGGHLIQGYEFRGKLKAVIFDMDGTLVDSRFDIAFALNEAFSRMGLSEHSEEEILRNIGPGPREMIGPLLPEGEKDRVEECFHLFNEIYFEHCLDRTHFYPGVRDTIEALAQAGVRMGVVSNKLAKFSNRILEGLGVRKRFQAVIGPEDVKNSKPDPEMIYLALGRMRVRVDQAMLVGDSIHDIRAGKAASILTLVVTYGYDSRERLAKESPDFMIDNVSELKDIILGDDRRRG